MKWDEYLRQLCEAEREFVRNEGGRSVMRGMSPIEMTDAAWEDPQGRLPCEPGYDTGAKVIELPAREPEAEPEPSPVVGDIFNALRRIGQEARRGQR